MPSGAPGNNMSQQMVPDLNINEYMRVPDKMVGLSKYITDIRFYFILYNLALMMHFYSYQYAMLILLFMYFALVLVIGRNGEQINRLQAESGCKIQMAPDSGGQPDRVCTLTGSRDAVAKARYVI